MEEIRREKGKTVKDKGFFSRHKGILIPGTVLLLLLACFVLDQAGVWDRLMGRMGLYPTAGPPEPDTLEVHFLDVGNADAALLMCDGAAMLIDGGDPEDGDMLLRHLRACGVEKLDLVIATHPDSDHVGGLIDLIGRIPVDRMLLSFMPEGAEPTTAVYLTLLERLESRRILTVNVKAGALYSLGSARVEILGPAVPSLDENEQSVVCRITYGENSFLFTGDAGEEEERSLLAAGTDLSADVLKVGHHGSYTSTTSDFLKAASPRWAVISCGEGNPYGHPHQSVVNRLKRAGVTVFRTDKSGTVVMVSDGSDITVRTEK